MAPGRPRLLPLSVVLAALLSGLVLTFVHHPRFGAYVIGSSVAAASLLRLLLSDRQAGLLVVRTRRLDVAVLGGLAVAIFVFTSIDKFPAPGR
jgi:Protein of unknown function (DUF3017)